MSNVGDFLKRTNLHKAIVTKTGTEKLSPGYKYFKPLVDPDAVPEEDEDLQETTVLPTAYDADIRKQQLEAERGARLVKGRRSTKTPGYSGGLGGKSILG